MFFGVFFQESDGPESHHHSQGVSRAQTCADASQLFQQGIVLVSLFHKQMSVLMKERKRDFVFGLREPASGLIASGKKNTKKKKALDLAATEESFLLWIIFSIVMS